MTDFELMKLCMRFDFGCANSTAKSLLCALASWYVETPDGDGYAWRPVRKLAIDAACDRHSIAPGVQWLVDKGLIFVQKGHGKSTIYRFNIPLIERGAFEVVRKTAPAQECEEVVRKSAPEVVQKTTPLVVRKSAPEVVRKSAPKKNQEKTLEKTEKKSAHGSGDSCMKHGDFSNDDFYKFAQVVFRSANLTKQVEPRWLTREGKLMVEQFATALYVDERVFERNKGVLIQAKAAMTARGF